MRQAIHIFKKDTRYLKFEIALLVLLAFAAQIVWPFAAAYLIARCIHEEALIGDNQFWLTRPYRRSSLLTAKLLFIATFIHLPFLLWQASAVLSAGFPLRSAWSGLLWSQVLLVFCLSIPAAALAAITPTLMAFIFVELVTSTIVFGLLQLWFFGISKVRVPWPSGVEWIVHSINLTLIAIGTCTILYLQYSRRRTLPSRVIAASLLAIGAMVFLLLPPQFALDAEVLLTKPKVDVKSIQLAVPWPAQNTYSLDDQPGIALSISVSGLQAGSAILVDGVSGVLQAADGATVPVYLNNADVQQLHDVSPKVRMVIFPAREFLQAHKSQVANFRGTLYFSVFGNPDRRMIPRQREPTLVFDRLKCSSGSFQNLADTRCMSAFRWPASLIGTGRERFNTSISYSPFAAELSISPFELHSAMSAEGLAPSSPFGPHKLPTLTIVSLSPLAHLKRELQIKDIKLEEVFRGGRPLVPK